MLIGDVLSMGIAVIGQLNSFIQQLVRHETTHRIVVHASLTHNQHGCRVVQPAVEDSAHDMKQRIRVCQ